jgi:putative endonuclease
MRELRPAVYILASGRNGTLYVGVTSDLVKRAWQHRMRLAGGFTARYGVHRLVWYEQHGDMEHAISREKRLKQWNRAWKLRLIEERNPQWRDLWDEILGAAAPLIPTQAGIQGARTRRPPPGGLPGFPPARE